MKSAHFKKKKKKSKMEQQHTKEFFSLTLGYIQKKIKNNNKSEMKMSQKREERKSSTFAMLPALLC